MTNNDAAPRIARVVLPPVLAPPPTTVNYKSSAQSGHATATAALASRHDPSPRPVPPVASLSSAADNDSDDNHHLPPLPTRSWTPSSATRPRFLCRHAAAPRVAYVLQPHDATNGSSSSSSSSIGSGSHPQQVICVQDVVTQQVLWNASWTELALLAWVDEHPRQQRASSSSKNKNKEDSASLPEPTTPPPPDPSSTAAFAKWIANFMGQLVALAFDDPTTLHWSGMLVGNGASDNNNNTTNNNNNANVPPPQQWQGLVVQTTKRILICNLRRGALTSPVFWPQVVVVPTAAAAGGSSSSAAPAVQIPPAATAAAQRMILAQLSDTTLLNHAIPSSNILPLTNDWLLVGCLDGSLKCFSRKAQQTVKSIKGLGKGDHCQLLLAANSYSSISSNAKTASIATPNFRRRMVTVTKKGTAYLIELELIYQPASSSSKNPNATRMASLEIKPPLARFSIGSSSQTHTTLPGSTWQQQALLQYDAARDWILWCQPNETATSSAHHSSSSSSSNSGNQGGAPPPPILHIWNLQALQTAFVKGNTSSSSSSGKSSGVLKPDPSLRLELAGGRSLAMVATADSLVGTAWGDDPHTFLAVTITATGDLFLQGACLPTHHQPQTVQATPVLGIQLADLLQRDAALDYDPPLTLQAHTCRTFPLGPTSNELLVSTSVGMLMVRIPLPPMTGARHVHFGAGLGSLGKSLLSVHDSAVMYSSVDSLAANPAGAMPPKNPVRVHASPPPLHLPHLQESPLPFRASSSMLLPSPSGLYVALVWPAEYKYEILHTPTLMYEVEQARGSTVTATATIGGGPNSLPKMMMSTTKRNACVASGTGVADFCWVGDSDTYAVLHDSDWEQAVLALVPRLQQEGPDASGLRGAASAVILTAPNLKDLGAGVMNVAMSATSVTKAATSMTLSATKAATSKTLSTTMAATQKVNKGFKKASFGLFGGGKKKKGKDDSSVDADDESVSTTSVMSGMTPPVVAAMPAQAPKEKLRYVELFELVQVETNVAELSGSMPAATSNSLGELELRGGNRAMPMVLFGGPVLCVGSRAAGTNNENNSANMDGEAHFYTRKKDEKDVTASVYAATGPTLPIPDVCTWDDDGRLFAIAIGSRVAVYISEAPDFCLLGTVRICSPSLAVAEVVSLKFIHGVLYCCTWNSVHCVLLGDLEGGVCYLDSYLLASTDCPEISAEQGGPQEPAAADRFRGLTPTPLALPLVQPVVLGYQSGSLMVSSLRGVFAVPLNHPLLRIGILLSSGQVDRATRWLDAVPESDHEALAHFLERRGHAELALQCLPVLSLETTVDMSMRHGYISRLEEAVETFGARGLRAIDMGRGLAPTIFGLEANGSSMIVCVGAYLLAHGRLELVRRLASECLRLDEQGKKDAFFLGTLLLPVNEADASRLIHRAVEQADDMQDWLMGKFVHDYILKKGNSRT